VSGANIRRATRRTSYAGVLCASVLIKNKLIAENPAYTRQSFE